jgi:4-aminobutyrate aminotransferase
LRKEKLMISETALNELSYREAPKIITDKIPGPKGREMFEEGLKYGTPTRVGGTLTPLVYDEGRGATVKDVDGNIFIDTSGGVAVCSVGRNNPKVVEAARSQAAKLMHPGGILHPQALELTKRICDMMPEGLRGNCFAAFTQSGSAAVETAIKYVHAITGKSQILAFEGGFHGVWHGSLALTTSTAYREGFRPFMPGVLHAPYAYCYRCFAGLAYPGCLLECAKYFDYKLNTPGTGADDVGAVFVEAIQGEGGYVDPPPEFLKMIKAACDKKGILFVVDEVQAGAGRSGKMWAIEHYDVLPDMLIFGKGIGGDQPMAGVAVREDFRNKLRQASQPNTFGENALSCAVALANIDILRNNDMDLIGRAARVGEEVKNRLTEAAKESKVIGEVRGKGLMIGIELVKSKETREPITMMPNIIKEARERGVLILPCGRYGTVLRLMPPLIISKTLLDKAIDIVLAILKESEADLVK